MKKKIIMKTRYIYFLALFAILASCTPEIDEFKPSKGNADFTSYIAVGNSLTAGYADGALYKSGQEYGWANILAQQLKAVGMQGEFKIPYMPDDEGVGFKGNTPVTKLVMGYSTDCNGNTSMAPVPADPNANPNDLFAKLMASVVDQGPFNNIGVPGIKVGHLLYPGLGVLNPYYGRFAQDPANDVLIDEVPKVNPTFFTLWIGNNDVLGYATSGGAGDTITPEDQFENLYRMVVDKIMATVSKGVLANIPTITAIPFLNTVPYNPIKLNKEQADMLNEAYKPYNDGMANAGLPYRINWKIGYNPMVVWDKYMQDVPFPQYRFRQLEEGELVTLTIPQDSLKCARWGTAKPVPDEYVLTEPEVNNVNAAIDAYNDIIKQIAEEKDLGYVDMASTLESAKNGVTVDGVTLSTTYVLGNIFSTDGVHLTPQGNAYVANLFIETINAKYGSKIPKVPVSDYPTIELP
jgi:lysophospholipase L1-like esterase